jgi:hypothetical protein
VTAKQQPSGGVLGDVDPDAPPGIGQVLCLSGDLFEANAREGRQTAAQPISHRLEGRSGVADDGRQHVAGKELAAVAGCLVDQHQAEVLGVPPPSGGHP